MVTHLVRSKRGAGALKGGPSRFVVGDFVAGFAGVGNQGLRCHVGFTVPSRPPGPPGGGGGCQHHHQIRLFGRSRGGELENVESL